MNLNAEQLEELNTLLSDPKLDLPTIRRRVDKRGTNYHWLRRNIAMRNSQVLDPRIKLLLHIK